MNIAPPRLAWLKSGLFWRTFFLLAFLIAASMATWVASLRALERTPRANQIAAQVISMVTITRAALTHSAPDLRRELLFELASNEGIRIYPLETTDHVKPPFDNGLVLEIEASVKEKLGKDTKLAGSVNDVAGFWISFKIDDDEYWLMLEGERIDHTSGIQWLGWATITLVLSLLGAVFISRLINQPLARLTAVAHAIAKGRQPEPLPESGSTEIREANRSFNQMVADLNRIESDRAFVLAGISHDLRTPISRMLLEVEMANLSADAQAGMQSDLGQMDAIIGQFLDYAKPVDNSSFIPFSLTVLLEEAGNEAARLPDVRITTRIVDNINVVGNPTDLRRIMNNLIENARRYGKTADTDIADIDLTCRTGKDDQVIIEMTDHGRGVPAGEIEHMLRPFTRLDTARSQANGAGLGLAIVERIIKRHGGSLCLYNAENSGLRIEIMLPKAKK
jgi:two-component system, OmpR family, osmolarity sensor histidine kinase EnvZ